MFSWMILFIFLGIGGFSFHVGVAKLFVTCVVGVSTVLLNLLFEESVFCRVTSNIVMFTALAYAIIVATNIALQMYF